MRSPCGLLPTGTVRSPVWTRVLPLSLCQVPRTDTHALPSCVEALSDLCLSRTVLLLNPCRAARLRNKLITCAVKLVLVLVTCAVKLVSSSLQGQVLCELPPSVSSDQGKR